jgi:hypothetical protein
MKTKPVKLKQLNIKVPQQELMLLKTFAERDDRSSTDVLREFIRSLQENISDPATGTDTTITINDTP